MIAIGRVVWAEVCGVPRSGVAGAPATALAPIALVPGARERAASAGSRGEGGRVRSLSLVALALVGCRRSSRAPTCGRAMPDRAMPGSATPGAPTRARPTPGHGRKPAGRGRRCRGRRRSHRRGRPREARGTDRALPVAARARARAPRAGRARRARGVGARVRGRCATFDPERGPRGRSVRGDDRGCVELVGTIGARERGGGKRWARIDAAAERRARGRTAAAAPARAAVRGGRRGARDRGRRGRVVVAGGAERGASGDRGRAADGRDRAGRTTRRDRPRDDRTRRAPATTAGERVRSPAVRTDGSRERAAAFAHRARARGRAAARGSGSGARPRDERRAQHGHAPGRRDRARRERAARRERGKDVRARDGGSGRGRARHGSRARPDAAATARGPAPGAARLPIRATGHASFGDAAGHAVPGHLCSGHTAAAAEPARAAGVVSPGPARRQQRADPRVISTDPKARRRARPPAITRAAA